MSSYIFELNNYHAVRDAKIKIDGITVLAGLNGSGKSTVSRWLHHVVYTLNQYESMVERSGVQSVMRFFNRIEHAMFSVASSAKAREIRAITDMIAENEISSVAQTSTYYDDICSTLLSVLESHFNEEHGAEDFTRIERFFEIEHLVDEPVKDFLGRLRNKLDCDYQNIIDKVVHLKETHTAETFAYRLFSIADAEIEENEIDLRLIEDGVELLTDEQFKVPLMLRNAIYIDTHKIGQALGSYPNSPLAKMLDTPKSEVCDSAHTIARMIQNIIGGEVLINRDYGKLMSGGKFKFVSKNGSSFNLKGAATGIISFSYILQLLQHGWINEDSILIIDEPESHLHPQWVVEYARVLVMIHKLIGTKIVISSHNPDMVSAIESITRKEALEKTTRFYLSEKVEDSDGLYSFRDLGFEITEIFDSFNIALDRIVFYGGS